jgi:hypothetical protein
LNELREFLRATEEANKRLSQEKTVLYSLSNDRTSILSVEYITKGKAAERAGVNGGQVLSLDRYYVGLLVHGNHLILSDDIVCDRIRRFGSDVTPAAVLNCVLAERRAERRTRLVSA